MYLLNKTDEYDNITITNCINNEINFDLLIATIWLTIQCGLSILCLMSLVLYTFIKTLLNNKWYWRKIYTQTIHSDVLIVYQAHLVKV